MAAHVSVPVYRRSLRQRYGFVAHKCKRCGKLNFPPKGVCAYCKASSDFDEVPLSRRGTIYAYTILSAAGAPMEFLDFARSHPNYSVALVRLDEGPIVIAQIVGVPPSAIAIGQVVELVLRKLYADEEVVRYGYKFRLVDD